MTREPDEPHLAFLLALEQFREPALLDHPFRVVVPVHLVHLHQVDAIGLESAQAVLDLAPHVLRIAGADLAHEEALLPPFAAVRGEGLAHDLFAAAPVVVPAVVEEVHAFIERGVHDADGFGFVGNVADVPAAEGEDGDVRAGVAEWPRGDAHECLAGRKRISIRVAVRGGTGFHPVRFARRAAVRFH